MKLCRKFLLVVICVGLIANFIGVQTVYAASITVNTTADELNNDGDCSLREAIQAANTDTPMDNCVAGSGADVITLAAGTYPLTIATTNEDANANGDLDITDADGLTIIGNNAIIQQTVIDRVFHVITATVTFQDLTITGGNSIGGGILSSYSTVVLDRVEVSGNTSAGRAGGIYNYYGTLSIQNGSLIGKSSAPNIGCGGGGIFAEGSGPNIAVTTLNASTVSYNESASCPGGGFYLLSNAQLIIENGSVVSNNLGGDTPPTRFTDPAGGGGIFASASPTITITDSTVSNNRANCAGNPNCGGGGLQGGTSVTITNSSFSNNTVNCNTSSPCGGGGIYNFATLTVTTSTFSGNNTVGNGNGGGIYNLNALTLTKSTLSGNSAAYGGGTYTSWQGNTIMENSTLSGNSATTNGSAIAINVTACAGGDVELRSTTIADGTSAGSAVYFDPFICVPGSLTMSNTIVERNGEANAFDFGGGNGFIDSGNNITNDNGANTPVGVAYHASLGLSPLSNNGGSTQTIALLTGSPAIDAGANCPGTDQRGASRPQGAGCDIGAFEVDDTFPTVVSDSLVASYASGAGPGSFTVTFSENVYDPAGDANLNDVTNPANYLLVEDGVNNTFNTGSCAGGLSGDDVQSTITNVTYNAALFIATVNLPAALPDGSYRLFVCGTTSIFDPASRELNDGLSDYIFSFRVGTAPSTTFSALPATGFAPHKVTSLPAQPTHLAYTTMTDIWLEIPSQNIKTNIVGVPQAENKTWDVKWLENNTGWLNGTAFPTWTGNSVLTAHVTNANGLPGPFANVKDLKYGDQLIVHLYEQSYIFEVRTSVAVRSGINAYAFQHLEEASYLTLITCQNYDEQTDSYRFRRIVRAVLVSVQ